MEIEDLQIEKPRCQPMAKRQQERDRREPSRLLSTLGRSRRAPTPNHERERPEHLRKPMLSSTSRCHDMQVILSVNPVRYSLNLRWALHCLRQSMGPCRWGGLLIKYRRPEHSFGCGREPKGSRATHRWICDPESIPSTYPGLKAQSWLGARVGGKLDADIYVPLLNTLRGSPLDNSCLEFMQTIPRRPICATRGISSSYDPGVDLAICQMLAYGSPEQWSAVKACDGNHKARVLGSAARGETA